MKFADSASSDSFASCLAPGRVPDEDVPVDQNSEVRLEDAGDGAYEIVGTRSGDRLGRVVLTGERVTVEVVPTARRRGVATTALREVSRLALRDRERLELLIPWDNPIALRLALAAGYTREGIRRGTPELLVYSRLASDSGEPAPRLLPDLPGGELSDGVITLRPLGEGDIGFYTELHSVPDVVATSVPAEPKPADEIHRRCSRAATQWLTGSRADLVIVDTATGLPAGEIDLYYQEPPLAQAMIGYSTLPAYRKRGLTTRAAQLLALWVFAETDIVRLVAGALPANIGSQRVLEKAGFTREAYQRQRLPGPDGGRLDDVQYVLLAGDLLAQASGAGTSHA
ncbi:GNAT family N-acetyltransferase [Actinoplanes hulinensis]|uniref:GNAT family N-acetyltransferase n=1 Tax=Actinoplanes hulinensis TaxID=1144547 RepID=A0ABS7AVJ8_9ACTN|nr:GNAT family N-acetyltransferase [Actinoplanes hulinensis]